MRQRRSNSGLAGDVRKLLDELAAGNTQLEEVQGQLETLRASTASTIQSLGAAKQILNVWPPLLSHYAFCDFVALALFCVCYRSFMPKPAPLRLEIHSYTSAVLEIHVLYSFPSWKPAC